MKGKTLIRYRPRIATLIVFSLVAAVIALANLTYDERMVQRGLGVAGRFDCRSYGWPLVWHRYVFALTGTEQGFVRGTIGPYCSISRLVANSVMWVMMLFASAAASEWQSRRNPLRSRWSLRAMLGFIALAGALLAWFAAAREHARIQDAISTRDTGGEETYMVRRWGPKWLGLFVRGCQYRGWITFLRLRITAGNTDDLWLLERLKPIGTLKHLEINVDRVTPVVATALSELRQVRALSIEERSEFGDADDPLRREGLEILGRLTWIEFLQVSEPTSRGGQLAHLGALPNLKSLRIDGIDDDRDSLEWHSDECLKAIGKMSQLQFLELHWMRPSAEGIGFLSGLTNLKWLSVEYERRGGPSAFEGLPPLPHLETVVVADSTFGDRDLRRLADMPSLKALRLNDTEVTSRGLSEFGTRSSIEELILDNDLATADGLEALSTFRRLKSLHLSRHSFGGNPRWARLTLNDRDDLTVLERDLGRCRRALQRLRNARPGIAIDADTLALWLRRENQLRPRWLDDDSLCEACDQQWLPAPQEPMTLAYRAIFEKAGGWANFHGAGVRDHHGYAFSVSF